MVPPEFIEPVGKDVLAFHLSAAHHLASGARGSLAPSGTKTKDMLAASLLILLALANVL